MFGAAIGSFLNVVALRYQENAALLAGALFPNRSFCPHCKKTLRWYELLPLVSFIIQGGRCRSCNHAISWQYPIVELLAGLLLAILPTLTNRFTVPELIIIGLAGLTFILLAAIDIRLMVIPDQLNLFLGILGVVLLIFKNQWVNHLFAGVVGAAVFGLIVLITRGKAMGIGDVKLAAALGWLVGWPNIAAVIFLAFVSGAVYATGLLIAGRKKMQDMVPFGPFLAFSGLAMMLYGPYIINVYLSLFLI